MLFEKAIDTFAVPVGRVSLNDQIGCVPLGAEMRHADARAGAVGVTLVVERDHDLDEAVRAASAERRPRVRWVSVRARCSACLNRLFAVVASLRSLARNHPFWTKVSLPSGRTSLTVAWRSTSGVDERTQRCTAPAPTTVVFALQRRRDVGHGGARRVLSPLPLPLRGVAPQAAAAGVASVVVQRQGAGVGGVPVNARRRTAVGRPGFRPGRGTRSGRWCPGPGAREGLLEAGVGVARRDVAGRRLARLRCRTARAPVAARRTRQARTR